MKRVFKIVIFSMIILVFNRHITFAKEIEQKIDNQNEILQEELRDEKLKINGNDFDKVYDTFQENNKNATGDYLGKKIIENLNRIFFNASIKFRKVVIIFYTLIICADVILVSTLGSNSIEKRRHYMLMAINITILFIIFINIPIILLYWQHTEDNNLVSLSGLFSMAISIIKFLQYNSFIISLLVFLYGLVQLTLSQYDVAKRLNGRYLIKCAVIIFLTLQLVPMAINFIL